MDGIKYTFTGQQFIHRSVKSLLSKIEFVKQNLMKIGISHSVTDVKGLVVTLTHPPINEYKGVEIESFKEI